MIRADKGKIGAKPEANTRLFSIIPAVGAFYLKRRSGTLASCCIDPGDFLERAYFLLVVASVRFECRAGADAGCAFAKRSGHADR